MYRFRSTRYITQTAVIIALLIALSLPTIFFKVNNTVFQITDGFFIALCAVIQGPMMLVVAIIYSPIMDLIGGAFIYIPITITIHALMFCIVKLLKKPLTSYGSFLIAAAMVFIYVLYTYLINLGGDATAIAISELITDAIQFGITIIISCIIYFALNKQYIKKSLFNDSYFDIFKHENRVDNGVK